MCRTPLIPYKVCVRIHNNIWRISSRSQRDVVKSNNSWSPSSNIPFHQNAADFRRTQFADLVLSWFRGRSSPQISPHARARTLSDFLRLSLDVILFRKFFFKDSSFLFGLSCFSNLGHTMVWAQKTARISLSQLLVRLHFGLAALRPRPWER